MRVIKESFRDLVLRMFPLVRELSTRRQTAFIQILFNSTIGAVIPHKLDSSKFVLANRYLNETFGCSKAFHRLNDELNIFQFSESYDSSNRIAKQVNIRPKVQEQLWFALNELAEIPGYLLDELGRRILTPPKAILSKDSEGNTRTTRNQLWSSMVGVNRESIKEYLEYLNRQERDLLKGRRTTIKRIQCRSISKQKVWITRAKLQCLGLLFASSLKGLPNGHMLLQYQESPSGRLFGVGLLHLQNVVREVKAAALAGSWDHDIKSCHFTLVYQIAKKHGYEAKAVKHYIDNKQEVHQHLLESYGIESEDAKKCLLSLIYGAPLTDYEKASIYKVLEGNATVFKEDPFVQDIKNDLTRCKKLIIRDGKISRGKLKNAVGKLMPLNKSHKSLASHILQGYEALALHTAIEQLDGNIQLLCHDGFVTKSEIDTKPIEDAFYAKTGLEITLSSKILRPKM